MEVLTNISKTNNFEFKELLKYFFLIKNDSSYYEHNSEIYFESSAAKSSASPQSFKKIKEDSILDNYIIDHLEIAYKRHLSLKFDVLIIFNE